MTVTQNIKVMMSVGLQIICYFCVFLDIFIGLERQCSEKTESSEIHQAAAQTLININGFHH